MAVPVISSRPEKTIGGYDSKWNAAGGNLPILYTITNDKFPVPGTLLSTTWTSTTSNSLCKARLVVTSTTGLSADQYVYLNGNIYNGIYRITAIGTLTVDINEDFSVNDSGEIKQGNANYKTEIDIYVGVPSGHPLNSDDPIALVGTMALIPDSDNVTYADIKSYVQTKLESYNNAGNINDIGLWTGFYIVVRESYDTSYGTRVTSADVSDISNPLLGVYATLPFGYQFGGNLNEYINDTGRTGIKWLSTNPTTFFYNRPYWDISAIVNVDTFDLIVEQYGDGDVLLQTDTSAYSGRGFGVYRFDLSGVLLLINAVYLNVYIEISSTQTSETMKVLIDTSLCNQELVEIGNFMLYEDGIIMDYEDDAKMVYEL